MGWAQVNHGAVLAGSSLAALLACGEAEAQVRGNPAYRSFFMASCPTATGPLASLCAVSRGGQISTDSQSSLTPSQSTATASTALGRAEALARTTEGRLEALRQEDGKTAAARARGWSLFASVQGEWSEQDRVDFANERGFDADATRLTVGGDVRLASGATIGASVSYGDYGSDFDANPVGNAFTPQPDAGGVDSEDLTFTVFGSLAPSPNTWIDGSAGIGFTDYDLRRNGSFQESNRVVPQTNALARADTEGREYHASVGAGWDLARGPLSFGPYVRLRYLRSKVDAYVESDSAGLGLAVSKSRATSLTSVLGGRASYAISTSWGVVVPQGRVEYEHEFEDDARPVTTRLALANNGPSFTVQNDAPDRNYFNLGAGLLMILPNGWMPFVDYEGLAGYAGFDRHRVTVGLRRGF